uniref:HET domain-containing protein n=1 Tax=Haemonchus contortus TaxID=6289 RepID=A0A7I4XY60_HAECO
MMNGPTSGATQNETQAVKSNYEHRGSSQGDKERHSANCGQEGIQSFEHSQRMTIRVIVTYAKESKIRWAGYVIRYCDERWTKAVTDWISRDVKRMSGQLPARWSDFFTKEMLCLVLLERGRSIELHCQVETLLAVENR